ncbi:hypothetical protein DL1_15930 [Thioclava dalianensis]|uniref:DUF3047 domain-containing protein n=1 Tax=Thioclava dalianensis TaxID=1185766 RepID=A0A074TFU2_9RHOB|nr:DUF3047 domain-containing protein [Thioclava dalianensis]KEP70596.1 hypothetical protein DL1_15930 [Thioclava dalianensis]SFN06953.1 Protein of unknown function [Thioclava dalianensis]
MKTGLAVLALVLVPTLAAAVPFGNWKEQRFSLFSSNDWSQSARGVQVRSQSAVSLIWTRVPPAQGQATRASWDWRVSQSVPATDLTRKGGDDRDLSVYFVFMPQAVAEANRGASIRKLLGIKEARVLMYVWGGEHARGAVLPTPYLGARGRTVILRKAGTGAHRESVDLAADYQRAFGERKTTLVGLALSSDSDDTDSRVQAALSDLELN